MQRGIYHISPFMESSRTGKTMLLEVKRMIILDWGKLLEGTCGSFGFGGLVVFSHVRWVLVAQVCSVCKNSWDCILVTYAISYM